jgi:DNA-binding CsgD family transcriptional regulator
MTNKSTRKNPANQTYSVTPQVLILCTHTNQELAQIAQTLGASLMRVTATTLVNIEKQLTQKVAPDPTAPTADSPETALSSREKELLQHLATGLGNHQIAQTMGISPRTVESHRQNIKRKLRLASQTSLIFYALRKVAAINAISLPGGAEQDLNSTGQDSQDPSSNGQSTRRVVSEKKPMPQGHGVVRLHPRALNLWQMVSI